MKVLFATPEQSWQGFLGRLRSLNPQHRFVATGRFHVETLRGVDVLIPAMTRIRADHLATVDRLRLIHQVGAGVEGIDVSAARARGIRVANVSTSDSGNADSVAELGVFLMIALARDVHAMTRSHRDRIAGSPLGQSLNGKTAAIIGLGGIGCGARETSESLRHAFARHQAAQYVLTNGNRFLSPLRERVRVGGIKTLLQRCAS